MTWRKSSFSDNINCVELAWRTSTFSDTNDCVEVAWPAVSVAVRDSKNPAGPTLTFGRSEFSAALKTLLDPGQP
jgi:hypothetical protein